MSAGRLGYDPETLPIGVVGRPHGLRGEITLRPHNVAGQDLGGLSELILERGGTRETRPVQSIRRGGEGWLVKLKGVDSRTDAEALTNVSVRVPRAKLPRLAEGEFFVADAEGCEVRTENGRRLGVVTEVFWNGAHDVMQIQGDAGEILIPVVAPFIHAVDIAGRTVVVAWDGEEAPSGE